jgi:hypothetical protein
VPNVVQAFTANSAVANRQFLTGEGTVDSSGNCVITIPNNSIAEYFTGTLTVYDSLPSLQWTVVLNGISIDILKGTSSVGGIQMGPNDSLSLTASNLLPYVGTTYHCTFACISTPASNTDLLVPGHDTIQSLFQSGDARIAATGQISTPFESFSSSININLLPGERSLVFLGWLASGHAQFTNLEIILSGNQSLINWTGNNGFTTASISNPIASVNSFEPLTIPIYGIEDQTAQMQLAGFGSVGGTALINYVILALPDAVLTGSQSNPLIVAQQDFLPSAEGLAGILLGSLVAGTKDTPVSVAGSATGVTAFVPAPAASSLYRIGTISLFNNGASSGFILQGHTSTTPYVQVGPLAGGTNLLIPFDAQLGEGLDINSITSVSWRVTTYYRELALVPNLI